MKPLTKFLALLAFAPWTASAQPPTNGIAAIRAWLATNTAIVHVPPKPAPKYLIVTGHPQSSRIFKSPDFKNWSRLNSNPATETNGGGWQFYRAEGACTEVSWVPATNATGYLILEYCPDLPGVWLTKQVGPTNQATMPAIEAGTNVLTMESFDAIGDFSAFSNWATSNVAPPTISISPTNSP